jgi:hypothetical protein
VAACERDRPEFLAAISWGWQERVVTFPAEHPLLGWKPCRGHLFRQRGELTSDTSPFAEPLPRLYARNPRWVRPALIGDVEYRSRTTEGNLRHPSWKGLRLDKTLPDLLP